MNRCLPIMLSALVAASMPAWNQAPDPTPPQTSPTEATSARDPNERPRALRSLRVVKADPEDMGSVPVGSALRRRIVFENTLNVPVEVAIAEKSSACTEASFDPARLEPGEHATLDMNVAVTPGSGQLQSVTFHARWTTEDGQTHTESGLCLLRYTPEIRYVVRPESTAAAVVRGGRASFDVFIRELESPDEPPDLEPIPPERPGWSIRRINDPDIPPGVLRFRVEGPVGEEPYADFVVHWRERDGPAPAVELPIRLRSLMPWRSAPGGVVIHGPRTPSTHRLALTPRITPPHQAPPNPVGEPATVRLRGGDGVVHASLQGRTLTVAFTPADDTPAIGSAWIDVLDRDSRLLTDIPVAWFLASTP